MVRRVMNEHNITTPAGVIDAAGGGRDAHQSQVLLEKIFCGAYAGR